MFRLVCTNCKTCYQDLSEIFEKTKMVINGETREVARIIPGVLERIEVTPELKARIAPRMCRLEMASTVCTIASATNGQMLCSKRCLRRGAARLAAGCGLADCTRDDKRLKKGMAVLMGRRKAASARPVGRANGTSGEGEQQAWWAHFKAARRRLKNH